MNAPCKDCLLRHHKCHSQCEEYKVYRNVIDNAFEEKSAAVDVRNFQVQANLRRRKMAGGHRR